MKTVEFGKENIDVIILLHGGGLSWWNYTETAELLKNRFHIVIPILDGHTGSDVSFTSIENNAKEIIDEIVLQDNNIKIDKMRVPWFRNKRIVAGIILGFF